MEPSPTPPTFFYLFWNKIKKIFENPKAASLVLALFTCVSFLWLTSGSLTPFWIGVTLAYLMEPLVTYFETRWRVSRGWASLLLILVTLAFLGVLGFAIFDAVKQAEPLARQWVTHAPSLLSQPHHLLTELNLWIAHWAVHLVYSFIDFFFILAISPLVAFFLLKDKGEVLNFLVTLLPESSQLLLKVVKEVDHHMRRYVLGKLVEILIHWISHYLWFSKLKLSYALFLSFLAGLATLFPYLGAVGITLPVALTAWAQWGNSYLTAVLLLGHGMIQLLEGHLLSFLLYAEATSLHPLWVILSTLIFGGWFGMKGLLFAVPLATLIKTIWSLWPNSRPTKLEKRRVAYRPA